MRKLVLVLALLLGGLCQGQTVLYVSGTTSISWDPVTLDAQGQAELEPAKVTYEACLLPAAVLTDPGAIPTVLVVTTAVPVVLLKPLLDLMPIGHYKLYVRAVDAAGNKGGWSDPFGLAFDNVPPAKPKNLKKA